MSPFVGPPPPLRGTFSDGWAIAMAKGRRINESLRAEVEFGFRSNTADQWSVSGVTNDFSGHLYAYTGTVNLIKDLEVCQVAGITPYAGAGLGLAILYGDFSTPATEIIVDDAAFAYQFMIGGSRQINSSVELFAEYRYFATTTIDVKNGPTDTVIDQNDPEFQNVFFGLRFYR